jgi:hypothetical protein
MSSERPETTDPNYKNSATRHTGVIDGSIKMWEKLCWDIECFDDIQRSYPDDEEPLAYAAINVCIAASSLGDWVEAEWKVKERAVGRRVRTDFRDAVILPAVKAQGMCDDIANTSKHSRLAQRKWAGGQVTVVHEPGDEDGPPGWMYYQADEQTAGFGLDAFQSLKLDWWTLLVELGLTSGPMYLPRWHQKKISAIFGLPIELDPPSEM